MIVRVLNTVPVCGRSIPNETSSELSALASPRPEEQPDDRGEHPDHERLEHHRAQHLAAGGAERAQRGQLARALGDRDRQRVGDHEAADEQRDAAEREQEVLEDVQEAAGVLGRLLGLVLTGLDLRARAAAAAGSGSRAGWATCPCLAATLIESSLPCLWNSCWASGSVKIAIVAPPSEDTPANLTVPTILNCWTGPRATTPISLADGVVVLAGGRGVDVDLVRGARPVAAASA